MKLYDPNTEKFIKSGTRFNSALPNGESISENVKSMQYANQIIFQGSQLWKLEGKKLQNKAGTWISADDWNFKTTGYFDDDFDFETFIGIENISQKKFLGSKYDSDVILEDGAGLQVWLRGQPNAEGYFILEISQMERDARILTATSSSDLKTKGNITLI